MQRENTHVHLVKRPLSAHYNAVAGRPPTDLLSGGRVSQWTGQWTDQWTGQMGQMGKWATKGSGPRDWAVLSADSM
jgi:hypothetical protein